MLVSALFDFLTLYSHRLDFNNEIDIWKNFLEFHMSMPQILGAAMVISSPGVPVRLPTSLF